MQCDTRIVYAANLNIWLAVSFLVFSFLLHGKNHNNPTKMLMSVQNFDNSFFSYLPVKLWF